MKEYLEKYPDQQSDIDAAIFAWGDEEVDEVCKEALKKNKQISFTNDEEKLDLLTYEFVDPA